MCIFTEISHFTSLIAFSIAIQGKDLKRKMGQPASLKQIHKNACFQFLTVGSLGSVFNSIRLHANR